MKSAKAFAPANISCIFIVLKGKTLQTTGSMGLGFTLNEGVNVTLFESKKTEIFFNGKIINFPTVISTIKYLTDKRISVSIISKLSLGYGFGLSGASSLATADALNSLLGLKKTKLQLAKIAHIAEVENGTGLGDVVNQYYKGVILKTVNSSQFIVHRIPLSIVPVYCRIFSKLSTKSVISSQDQVKKINKAGERAIREIESRVISHESKTEKISFAEIIQLSKQFALESGLLQDKKVIQAISDIESIGGNASMIMLGNAVFSDIPFEGSSKYLAG